MLRRRDQQHAVAADAGAAIAEGRGAPLQLLDDAGERLAAADCFGSIDLPRRQALWDARTLVGSEELPLFAAAREREEGAEREATRLPSMALAEEVVADYQTHRLSLKAHPLSFLRPSLAERGFVRAEDLRTRKFYGEPGVAVARVVVDHRQGVRSGLKGRDLGADW